MHSGSPGPEWPEVGRRQSSLVCESHCEVGEGGQERTLSENSTELLIVKRTVNKTKTFHLKVVAEQFCETAQQFWIMGE